VGSAPYEIRVRGKLGKGVINSFAGFEVEVEPAETILRGSIDEQGDLHALIDRIQALGLDLIEVRRLDRTRSTRER
jgi:hypothetical protein